MECLVSWGTSFYKGFVILLWCIVWGIIGGIIAVALGLGSLWVNFSQPDFWQFLLRNPEYLLTILTESLVGFLIGGIIAFIGQFASFFKVTVDGAAGEVKKLKDELGQLKDNLTRRVAEELAKNYEMTKQLEKRIQEVKNEAAEAVIKTREMLAQVPMSGGEKRNLPRNGELERLKVDLAEDIARRIVEEVNKNWRREKEAAFDSSFGDDNFE